MQKRKEGNCYYASEALYHLLGGKRAGWKPCVVKVPELGKRFTHWFLLHKSGLIVDPTKRQFYTWRKWPDYKKAKGCGFQTKRPSKRARALMEQIVWH